MAFGASSILRKAGLGIRRHSGPGWGRYRRHGGGVFVCACCSFSGGKQALKLRRRSAAWLFPAAVFNTAATLSVFYALSHGKVVIVEPLVSSNPVLTLFFTAIFLRDSNRQFARYRRRSSSRWREQSSLYLAKSAMICFDFPMVI